MTEGFFYPGIIECSRSAREVAALWNFGQYPYCINQQSRLRRAVKVTIITKSPIHPWKPVGLAGISPAIAITGRRVLSQPDRVSAKFTAMVLDTIASISCAVPIPPVKTD